MKQLIWTNLKKYAIPGILGAATLDGWLSTKRAYYHDQYMRLALQEGLAEAEAAKKATIQTDRAMTQLNQNIFAVSDRLDTATQAVNENGNNISKIAHQLTDPNLDPTKKMELSSHLNYYQKCYQSAVIKQNAASEEMKNLSSYNDPDIIKSDFSELFNHLTDFIDWYREYISNCSPEQLVILFNLCGYSILFMLFTTITFLLIGDQLINYFELESKYPKLAKYIHFQLTLRKYYLRFYIVSFYLTLIVLISVNIFMFTYNLIFLV